MLQCICGFSSLLKWLLKLSGSTPWPPQVIHKNNRDHASFPSTMVSIASQLSPSCMIVLNMSSRVPKRHSDGYFLNPSSLLCGKHVFRMTEVCCWLVCMQGCHLTCMPIFYQEVEKTHHIQRQWDAITPPPSSSTRHQTQSQSQ